MQPVRLVSLALLLAKGAFCAVAADDDATTTAATTTAAAAAAAAAADAADDTESTDTTATTKATKATTSTATTAATINSDDASELAAIANAAVAATASTDADADTDTASADAAATAGADSSEVIGNSALVGTWTSKSNTVFTGSGFYDPIDELLIEPALPGISYSFTEDGYWEEALYQITPDAQNHSCAVAALIYQHGTYSINDTGYITLTPFEVDGRQLLSDPCNDDGESVYSRYTQEEAFKGFNVYIDPYHGRYRLDLVQSTGPKLQPLYLAYRPPQMLPTITMNPTDDAGPSAYIGDGSSSGTLVANTDTAAASAASSSSKAKRDLLLPTGLSQKVKRSLENRYRTNAVRQSSVDYDFWWWVSASLCAVGATMFLGSRIM